MSTSLASNPALLRSGLWARFGRIASYLEMGHVLGLGESIRRHLNLRSQGWDDTQMILSLVLLNLAGGDCVEDFMRIRINNVIRFEEPYADSS